MSQFYLHFFKEKSRTIDMEQVIEHFESEEGFEVEMDDKAVRFLYSHPRLGYVCAFYITRKSQVPNIQRVSPKYLEVNFHLELPILSPNYFVKHVIQLVKKVCDKFDLFVLSEMFNDVLEFNADRIFRVYQMVKKAYLEKYPEEQDKYYFFREEKLNSVLRYMDEMVSLQAYYDDLDTIVPKYHFIKDEEDNPYLAVEWKENSLTVFPPYVDYLLYRQADDMVKVIDYNEFLKKTEKLLLDVPGFLQGTKVVSKKANKKLNKIARKGKFTPVAKSFSRYHLHQVLDA
ncbi:hypothetical protein [Acholeplasma hippikon]|uniref:Uncharacterized protein n=1 Tax=Acholeplasma hippikon TaxID=264636 RepID=A0A449BIW7_9MOLU|nr:hypothetical protein [Acholeplasma hippikon]VEU82382.1 Uncharacterised protein [Acholeplasma hippikon]